MPAELDYKVENWWPTTVVRVAHPRLEAFNARLAQIVRAKEAEIINRGKPTRVAGLEDGLTAHWLEYNVLNWDHPECRQLRRMALLAFRRFVAAQQLAEDPGMTVVGISCWANILRPGQTLQVHHHDPAYASAHYTVATGMAEEGPGAASESGHTIYFRPGFLDRSHGGKQNGTVSPWDEGWRISSAPHAGAMIVFPSYVRHEVRPNLGSADRISIAMDFFVRKQEALMYFGGPRWYVPTEADFLEGGLD